MAASVTYISGSTPRVGIKEDLKDFIYNVDPMMTPFLTNAPKSSAKNTFHEWLTDSYSAVSDNKAVEGADATYAAESDQVRLGNYTQISQSTAEVSGTLEAVDKAGMDKAMTYAIVKHGVELRRDMENGLVGLNNARVAGNSSTARESASMQSWINTNTSSGVGGSDPTGDGTNARTDGTQRAFTEGLLETVIDSIFNSSGEMADTIMVGSFNKRAINGFTGRATSTDHNVAAQSIISAADVYKSDYGDLKIIPNVFSRSRDALVYKKDKWAVSFLRNMKVEDRAKVGDSERKQIITEYTLEARNEKSSGIVADLTTS